MVAPKHAWLLVVNSSHRHGRSATRMIVIGALLFSALHLHERAAKLEQRERSLQQRIGAFSRQTRTAGSGTGTHGAMAPSLERVPESSPAKPADKSATFDEGVVRRADYQEVSPPIAVRTTAH
jgi:hypothetical protein